MRSILFIALHTILVGTIAHAQSQSVKADEKTTGILKKFRSDYSKMLMDDRPELLQSYYTDTVRLMPPFQITIIGKDKASLYQKGFLTRFTVHDITRNEIEILDLGAQIMETGTFTMRLTIKSRGKEQLLKGKYLNLWQETKNGELLLLTEAWNYDEYYGEIHDLLRFDEVPGVHTAFRPNVPVNSNISFELAALNRLLDVTVTQHDWKTWSLYYSDDAMLMASYYPICKGKKAVDEYIHTHVKELPIFEGLDIRNDRIDNLGVYVIEYASHIASWKNEGNTGVGTGKNIRIWRRGEDHTLRLFRSISMYD